MLIANLYAACCIYLQFNTGKNTGIYRDKTITDKLMYISNDVTQNYFFCRLQLVIETFGHSTKWTNESKFKVPKIVRHTNKKTLT